VAIPALLVKEAVFFTMYVFGAFVKNQMAVMMWAYFLIFYSIGLCVFLFQLSHNYDFLKIKFSIVVALLLFRSLSNSGTAVTV
jgi:hypothetical protein